VTLLFLCCHPALTPASQVALTLRAVGGLTTAEVAQAFLVPEATMAPRISRAKQRIRAAGGSFRMPTTEEWAERLGAVLHVLYLIFNEGYTASSGPQPDRAEPDGHSQPRRRGRDDPQAAGRARTAGDARRRRPDGPPLPPAHGARLAK
jgi:predicted RNA polymerase sigma factor